MVSKRRALGLTSLSLFLPAVLIVLAYSDFTDDNVNILAKIAKLNASEIQMETEADIRIALTMLGAATFKELTKVRKSRNSTAPNIRVVFFIPPEKECVRPPVPMALEDCDSKTFTVLKSDEHEFMVEADLYSNRDLSFHCRAQEVKDFTRRMDYKGRFDVPRFDFESFQIWYKCGQFRNYENTEVATDTLFTFKRVIVALVIVLIILSVFFWYIRRMLVNNARGANLIGGNAEEPSSSDSVQSNETATTRGTAANEGVEMKDVSAAIRAQLEREARLAGEVAEEPVGESSTATEPPISAELVAVESEAVTAGVQAAQTDKTPVVAAEEEPLLDNQGEARVAQLRR